MKANLTGGPLYHLRAGIRILGQWRSFRNQVEKWLTEWQPQKSELVLIGPSGGWTLPDNFLYEFKKIHAYDLDPLARGFFAFNHGVDVEWHREDAIGMNAEKLLVLKDRHPNAAFLFCNMLGQLGLLYKTEWGEDLPEDFIANMQKFFRECGEWASYHERVSMHKKELVDHMTAPLFQDFVTVDEFRWSFSSQSIHIVDWITSSHKVPGS